MMLVVQINLFLYKTEKGKMEWGIGEREGERERKKQSTGVGVSVGENQKWRGLRKVNVGKGT
jgi:hypothetical protein